MATVETTQMFRQITGIQVFYETPLWGPQNTKINLTIGGGSKYTSKYRVLHEQMCRVNVGIYIVGPVVLSLRILLLSR